MNQPTDQELNSAWTNAINMEGSGAAFSSAIQELRRLRNLRTTWYGSSENNLRSSLSKYLEKYS